MSRSGSLLNVKITSRQNDTLIAKICNYGFELVKKIERWFV